jgi:hypothetical protein
VLLISICSHELVHDLAPNRKSIVLLIEMHSASLMLQAVRGPFWPVVLTVGLLCLDRPCIVHTCMQMDAHPG